MSDLFRTLERRMLSHIARGAYVPPPILGVNMPAGAAVAIGVRDHMDLAQFMSAYGCEMYERPSSYDRLVMSYGADVVAWAVRHSVTTQFSVEALCRAHQQFRGWGYPTTPPRVAYDTRCSWCGKVAFKTELTRGFCCVCAPELKIGDTENLDYDQLAQARRHRPADDYAPGYYPRLISGVLD